MNTNKPEKNLSLWDTTAIIVGIVIGAGIFKFPTLVAMNVGSDFMLILVWVLGGAVSFIGAMTYAELASAYPHSGGDYFYLQKSFGSPLSFLFAWTRMLIIQPGSMALMAFVIGDEIVKYYSFGSASAAVYALLVVILLTALNYSGIRQGKIIQNILTILIYAGLLLLVIAALFAPAASESASGATNVSGFGMAMVFVLLTFGGWNESAYVSAELKEPGKNMVRALVVGIGSVTIIYLLVNLALLSKLGLKQMASFDAPQRLVELSLGKEFSFFISLTLILAALSTTNATIITGARSNYALAQDYPLFRFMSQWHEKNQTPTGALVLQGAITIALILFGSWRKDGLSTMVDYTSPAFWFFFTLTGISLFVLRRRDNQRARPFQVPLYPVLPALFVVITTFMLYSSLAYTGLGALVSVLIVAAGALLFLIAKKQGQ